jgi:hypothetical protein
LRAAKESISAVTVNEGLGSWALKKGGVEVEVTGLEEGLEEA